MGLHRGYPLCQGRPVLGRSEGHEVDPLTLCAAKRFARTDSLRALHGPLCSQAAPRIPTHQRPGQETHSKTRHIDRNSALRDRLGVRHACVM